MGALGDGIEAIMLGSGTSHGVPMIGCDCEICRSEDPRDRRTRTSFFLQAGGQRILIDTAPELRLQCIANNITAIDAVLFTHHHADHVVGLDDLRRFNWLMKRHVVCYGTAHTLDRVKRMFSYAFAPPSDSPHSRPHLELKPIDHAPFQVGGLTVTPIPLLHGSLPVLGFRVGDLAYCTDCNVIPPEAAERLRDLDVLVLDCLRRRPHPAHFNLEESIDAARKIGARQTYFTHMAHELGHEATNAELPDGMALGYDGLRIALA